MMGVAIKFLTSRTGIILMIAAALFTWHKLDKGTAVRDAVVRYVADQELTAAEAEAEFYKNQAENVRLANRQLLKNLTNAEKDARDAEQQFLDYRKDNPPVDGCAVNRDLFGILRAN